MAVAYQEVAASIFQVNHFHHLFQTFQRIGPVSIGSGTSKDTPHKECHQNHQNFFHTIYF